MKNLKLKGAIAELGMSYERFSVFADVSRPTIANAVTGENISIKNAKKICIALNKTLTEIFGD